MRRRRAKFMSRPDVTFICVGILSLVCAEAAFGQPHFLSLTEPQSVCVGWGWGVRDLRGYQVPVETELLDATEDQCPHATTLPQPHSSPVTTKSGRTHPKKTSDKKSARLRVGRRRQSLSKVTSPVRLP